MGQSLHDFVIERLEESKGEWQSVADGSGVSRRTLEKIARREIADPGVSHIEKLAAFFRQKKRKVA